MLNLCNEVWNLKNLLDFKGDIPVSMRAELRRNLMNLSVQIDKVVDKIDFLEREQRQDDWDGVPWDQRSKE